MKKIKFSKINMGWKVFSVITLVGVTLFLFSFKGRSGHKHQDFSGEQLFRGLIFMDGQVANLIPELKDRMEVKKLVALSPAQQEQERKIVNVIVREINANQPGYFDEFKKAMTSGDQQIINTNLVGVQEVIMRSLASYLGIKLDNVVSAREQISRIVGKNPNNFQAAIAQLKMKRATPEQFNSKMQSALNLDRDKIKALLTKDGISPAAFEDANKQLCGGCVAFLSVLACNAGVVVNIAGYVNVALVGNVAVALNAAVALNIAVTVEVTVNSSGALNAGSNSSLQNESFVNSIATVLN